MIFKYYPVGLLFALGIVISCGRESILNRNFMIEEGEKNSVTVPLDQALRTLEDFMAENEGEMIMTKSSEPRVIESIDVRYAVRDSIEQEDSIPELYIVNFAEKEGFAILGATEDLPRIITLSESGYLDPVSLCVEIDSVSPLRPDTTFTNSGIIPMPMEFDNYCPDVDDYYVLTNPNVINVFIDNGIQHRDESFTRPGTDNILTEEGLPAQTEIGAPFSTSLPMTQMHWGQGDWNNIQIFNKYCYKKVFGQRIHVLAGCSTVALALIIATNEFPQDYSVNGMVLDYSQMKRDTTFVLPDFFEKEHVSLLYGSIFHNVNRLFAFSEGTCILPSEIRQRMADLGYSDVKMLKGNSFNQDMLEATSYMMQKGTPVFLSAVAGLLGGHSWVIDGAKYDSEGEYLLHCNWGWRGAYNGYYSPNCFDPGNSNYTWHFRLITYKIPTENYSVTISFD